MDGQEYLNQISASTRPTNPPKSNRIFSSKFFLIGAIGLGTLIVIIIIGAILGSNKGGEKEDSIKLFLHLNNTVELIDEYQPSVESSTLRSSSASLKGSLSDTSKKMEEYLVAKYNFKEKDVDKKTLQQLTSEKESLNEELFEAKINGILDRIYAHKMSYEIQVFIAENSKVLKVAKDDVIKEILDTFNLSLENLYDQFNDFSEGK